jgi:hypothetical protein
MAKRIDKLETDVAEIKKDVAVLRLDVDYLKRDVGEIKADLRGVKDRQERDFRLLFGAIIFVALGLTGVLAKGFGWIH